MQQLKRWCTLLLLPINVSFACMQHELRALAVRLWFMRFVSAEWCPVWSLSWQHFLLVLYVFNTGRDLNIRSMPFVCRSVTDTHTLSPRSRNNPLTRCADERATSVFKTKKMFKKKKLKRRQNEGWFWSFSFSEKKNTKYLMSFIVELLCVTLAMTSQLHFYTTLWLSHSTFWVCRDKWMT